MNADILSYTIKGETTAEKVSGIFPVEPGRCKEEKNGE
jgi:hypothetical protein